MERSEAKAPLTADRRGALAGVNEVQAERLRRRQLHWGASERAHGAAALVIARRAYRFSENPTPCNGQGTSPGPVRKRGEHVWTCWRRQLWKERRLQRPSGRRQTIRAVPGIKPGTARTILDVAGAIPAREFAAPTVRAFGRRR